MHKGRQPSPATAPVLTGSLPSIGRTHQSDEAGSPSRAAETSRALPSGDQTGPAPIWARKNMNSGWTGRGAPPWAGTRIDFVEASFERSRNRDERDERPVWGETGNHPPVRDPARGPAQGIDDINAPAVALGAEHDLGPVGREAGVPIVGRVVGQPEWLASRDLLDPEVQRSASFPVRGVDHELAVRGKSGGIGEAGIKSQAGGLVFDIRGPV